MELPIWGKLSGMPAQGSVFRSAEVLPCLDPPPDPPGLGSVRLPTSLWSAIISYLQPKDCIRMFPMSIVGNASTYGLGRISGAQELVSSYSYGRRQPQDPYAKSPKILLSLSELPDHWGDAGHE